MTFTIAGPDGYLVVLCTSMDAADGYAGVMAPRRLGIILLFLGAVNACIGIMLVIQIPAERTGGWPYVILVCGLLVMFSGYYIGKRKA